MIRETIAGRKLPAECVMGRGGHVRFTALFAGIVNRGLRAVEMGNCPFRDSCVSYSFTDRAQALSPEVHS